MIPLKEYKLTRFGGLNTKLPDSSLKPHEAKECLNLYFEGDGVTKRAGVIKLATGIGSAGSKITGMFNIRTSSGANKLMAVADNGTTADIRDAANNAIIDDNGGLGFTSGAKFTFVQYLDLAIYCNDVEGIRKYDGATSGALGGAPPDTCKVLGVHNNFVLAANAKVGGIRHKNKIFYSALGNPESWSTGTDFLNFRLDDGDEIVAIVPFTEETSLVFKKHSIWKLSGFGQASFSIALVFDGIGAANPYVVDTIPSSSKSGRAVIFLSSTGRIYLITTSPFTQDISEKTPLYASDPIQDILSYYGLEEADLDKFESAAISTTSYKDDGWFLFVPSKISNGEADICIRYDYTKSDPERNEFWFSRYSSRTEAYKPHSVAISRHISAVPPYGYTANPDGEELIGEFDESYVQVPAGGDTETCQFYDGTTNPPGVNSNYMLVQQFDSPGYGIFVSQVGLRLKKGTNPNGVKFYVEVMDVTNLVMNPLSRSVYFYTNNLPSSYDWVYFDIRSKEDPDSPVYIAANSIIQLRVYWAGEDPLGDGHLGETNYCWERYSTNQLGGFNNRAIVYNKDGQELSGVTGDFTFQVRYYRVKLPAAKFSVNTTGTVQSFTLKLYQKAGNKPGNLAFYLYGNTTGCTQGKPDEASGPIGRLLTPSSIKSVLGGSYTDAEWHTFLAAGDINLTQGVDYWLVAYLIPRYDSSNEQGYTGSSNESARSQYAWSRKSSGGPLTANQGRWAGIIGDPPTSFSDWSCALDGYSFNGQINFEGGRSAETMLTGDKDGNIWQHGIGFTDDGLPIEAKYRTSWLDFDEFGKMKAVRYVTPIVEGGGSGNLNLKFFSDFSITPSDEYDIDMTDVASRSRIFRRRTVWSGRYLQMLFSESSTVRWKLERVSIEYQLKTGRRSALPLVLMPGGSGGSGGIGSIDPSTVSGILWHSDATQITGYSDGQDLSQWDDISGNNRHKVPTWTPGPGYRLSARYRTNIQNGLPMVEFYAPDPNYQDTFLGLKWVHGIPDYTQNAGDGIVLIFVEKAVYNAQGFLGEMYRNNYGTGIGGWDFEIWNDAQTSLPNPSVDNMVRGKNLTGFTIPMTNGEVAVIALQFVCQVPGGSGWTLIKWWKNGTRGSPDGNHGVSPFNDPELRWQTFGGSGNNNKWCFLGFAGECIGYGVPLDDNTIVGISNFLKDKWGIT